MNKSTLFFISKAVKMATINSANSTSSGTIYQPKVPKTLKKFNKIRNDK